MTSLSQKALTGGCKQDMTRCRVIGELGPKAGSHYAPEKLQDQYTIYEPRQFEIVTGSDTQKDQETMASEIKSVHTYIGMLELLTNFDLIGRKLCLVLGAGCGEAHGTQNGNAAGTSTGCASQNGPVPGLSHALSRRKKNRRTRRQRGDQVDYDDDGEDDDQPPYSRKKVEPGRLGTIRSWACPFYLFDKERHRNCLRITLNRLGDVRQHIIREHIQPSWCARCGIEFRDDFNYAQRDAHNDSCQVNENDVRPVRPPGATSEQLGRMNIAARYRGHGSDKEERWYTVWDIMFPGSERPPSPFIDVTLEWDHTGLCAAINRYQHNGGVQDFNRQEGQDFTGALNSILNHFRQFHQLFLNTGNFQGVPIPRPPPLGQTSSSIFSQPTVPTMSAIRVLAPRPAQANLTPEERASNQG